METPDGHASADAIHERVSARLASMEQRYTKGRRKLVGLLSQGRRPLALPELVAEAPDLPQSSIYRNLELLESAGLVRRLTVGGDHARFELAEPLLEHHHHLICVSCGTIEDITLDETFENVVDKTLEQAAAAVGFVPLHHTVDLHGRCANCG